MTSRKPKVGLQTLPPFPHPHVLPQWGNKLACTSEVTNTNNYMYTLQMFWYHTKLIPVYV